MEDIGRVRPPFKLYSLFLLAQAAQQVVHIQEEMKLHIAFCKEYGISEEEMQKQDESAGECISSGTGMSLRGQ